MVACSVRCGRWKSFFAAAKTTAVLAAVSHPFCSPGEVAPPLAGPRETPPASRCVSNRASFARCPSASQGGPAPAIPRTASRRPYLAACERIFLETAGEAVRDHGGGDAPRSPPRGRQLRATRIARARARSRGSSIRASARGSCSSSGQRCAYKRLLATDVRRAMLAALLQAIYELATPPIDEICYVSASKARFSIKSQISNPRKNRGARARRARLPGAAWRTSFKRALASNGFKAPPALDLRAPRAPRIFIGSERRELLRDGRFEADT